MLDKLFKKKTEQEIKPDWQLLIDEAEAYPRYTEHNFFFRGISLCVTDFVSVAYQIKEYFVREALKFESANDNPIIYDCGANVGIASIYFKKLFPKAKIKAFEPDVKVFKCLEKNLNNNGINDVQLFNAAVWINDQPVNFGSEGGDGGSIYFDTNKSKVPAIRLVLELSMEKKIDLLKVDIEGAEVELIKDCDNELNKVKNIFIEYHSWEKNPQQLDQLLRVLSKNNFRYYIHSEWSSNHQLFLAKDFPNGMDVQLNIFGVNLSHALT